MEKARREFTYQSNGRSFDIILQAKEDSLLTLDSYREMLELHDIIFTAVQEVQELELDENLNLVEICTGKKSAYSDICELSRIVFHKEYAYKKNTVDKNVSKLKQLAHI